MLLLLVCPMRTVSGVWLVGGLANAMVQVVTHADNLYNLLAHLPARAAAAGAAAGAAPHGAAAAAAAPAAAAVPAPVAPEAAAAAPVVVATPQGTQRLVVRSR